MNQKKLSNFFIGLGVVIIMISLIYMIINLSNADNFINTWMTFMITGVSSVLWGVISLYLSKKLVRG
jgi:formate-dependent nitrite reductase membrane component NrfD